MFAIALTGLVAALCTLLLLLRGGGPPLPLAALLTPMSEATPPGAARLVRATWGLYRRLFPAVLPLLLLVCLPTAAAPVDAWLWAPPLAARGGDVQHVLGIGWVQLLAQLLSTSVGPMLCARLLLQAASGTAPVRLLPACRDLARLARASLLPVLLLHLGLECLLVLGTWRAVAGLDADGPPARLISSWAALLQLLLWASVAVLGARLATMPQPLGRALGQLGRRIRGEARATLVLLLLLSCLWLPYGYVLVLLTLNDSAQVAAVGLGMRALLVPLMWLHACVWVRLRLS